MTPSSDGSSATPGDALAWANALVEAAAIVAACVGRDLDAVLDALVEQTQRLVDTKGVAIHLARAGGRPSFAVRRTNPLARGAAIDPPGGDAIVDDFVEAAIAAGQPLFTSDFQGEPRISAAAKEAFPTVVATCTVPLFADGAVVGILFVHWDRPHRASDEELRALAALGHHAAIAIRSTRLLDDARRARGEIEAILDAAGDAILVVDTRGELVRANDVARQWLMERLGLVPNSISTFRGEARITAVSGESLEDAPLAVERALAGEASVEELVIADLTGVDRHIHVSAAPIRSDQGGIIAAVVVARDITALRESIAEHARLDGAVKTARRISHELKNELTLVVGYGELLTTVTDGTARDLASKLNYGATQAADTLDLLQRIIRFEEIDFGGQIMLDLEAATRGYPDP